MADRRASGGPPPRIIRTTATRWTQHHPTPAPEPVGTHPDTAPESIGTFFWGEDIVNALRTRLDIDNDDDDGISLVEIVVAMMIFALISTGLLYSMISVLNVNRDSRTRQVAANLAAEEIDRARAVEDILKIVSWDSNTGNQDLQDPSRPRGNVVLNKDVFMIERTVAWVPGDTASTERCGSSAGGSTLRYKRINVEISWKGMKAGSEPVRADSVINPRAKINDPSKGTILIDVKNAASVGVPGITVTSSPGLTVSPTDTDGCTYIFRVPPGTYTVGIAKPGYVDNTNVESPTRTVIVREGKAENRVFQYDVGIRYSFSYPGNGFAKASSMKISAIDTNGVHTSDAPTSQLMHPAGSSYTFVAGDAGNCPASDPVNWTTTTTKRVVPAPSYSSAPGTIPPSSIPIAMGLVTLDNNTNVNGNRYIRAISTTGTGHPACLTETTLNFPQNQKKIALPYGSWRLQVVNGNNVSNLNLGSIVGNIFGGNNSTNVITIDPRVAP